MPLFFIHIPKTAGTSFRLGAEDYFGQDKVVYDYGKDSTATSRITREHLYNEKPDFWWFNEACYAQGASMVGGHVNAGRFVSLFGVSNTITFIREPLQRMASEYAHFVRHNGYEGNFREFYSRPVMQNRQAKILNGINLEDIGFLGLTERYVDSLEMLNAHYSVEIPQREDNRGKASLIARHEIGPEDEAELKRLNARDIELFHHAYALSEARWQQFQRGLAWAHARLAEASTQRVTGWAWWAGGGKIPVEVEVWVNGRHVDTRRATDLRPNLCRLLPPRGGYVGFHAPLRLEPGDLVQCCVAKTGQWFPAEPRRVPEPETK